MQIRIQAELDCLGEGRSQTQLLAFCTRSCRTKKKLSGICSGKKGNWNVSLHSAPPSHSGHLVANGSFTYLLCTLYVFGDKICPIVKIFCRRRISLWISALRKCFIKPLVFIFVMGQVGKNMLIKDPRTTASIIGSSVFSHSLNLCVLLKG